MSDTAVTERRIKPIQDAIASQNWKQALRECEKWHKKGEKSDRFLAIKAAVLVRQPDVKQQEKGKVEVLQLCRRQPAVVTVEALYQLQDTLKYLSLEREEGPKLWERAASATAGDKDLLTTWLNGSLHDADWLNAQKATAALRKAFPKERQYDLWNMLLCYLVHRDRTLTDKERSLFGTLAYRMMLKVVESPSSENGILSPEEAYLMTKIFTSTGNTPALLKLLQNEDPSLNAAREQDSPFVFSMYLEVLNESHDWQYVFDVCKDLLSNPSAVEDRVTDERIWKLVIRTQSQSDSLRASCRTLIDSVLSSNPTCREAHLAKLRYLMGSVYEDPGEKAELLAACRTHYDLFSGKAFCFDDLIQPLRCLETTDVRAFHNDIEENASTPMQKMFSLKLEYNYTIAEKDVEEAKLIAFATKALSMHDSIPKNLTACPEAVLLSALTLLKLAYIKNDLVYTLQATALLHSCSLSFRDYYPLSVSLVQTHLRLGQPTLAMTNFVHMSIKNIQWETVGHLVLTRISTVHPWQTGIGEDALSPLGAFDAALIMLSNADRSLDKSIREGMKNGSYTSVIDAAKVRSDLRNSLNKRLLQIEERRIQRIHGMPIDELLEPPNAELIDLRDVAYIPTYGNLDGELEHYRPWAPVPNQGWVAAMTLQDHLGQYLGFELSGQASLATSAVESMKLQLEECSKRIKEHMDMTPEEQQATNVVTSLAKLAILLQDEPSKSGEIQRQCEVHLSDVVKYINDRDRLLTTAYVGDIPLPDWPYLHSQINKLQLLQICASFMNSVSKKNKAKTKGFAVSKDRLADIQNSTKAAIGAIHETARKLKSDIGVPGILGKLIDLALGRGVDGIANNQLSDKLETFHDEVALEGLCGAMRDSWEDAIDGILQMKIKQ